MEKLLSMSLVLYNNTKREINQFISLVLNSSLPVFLFVIDNSPTDYRKSFFIDLRNCDYTFLNDNKGYGKAHNVGIKKSIQTGFKYHLIINPDIQFNTSDLQNLINFMESELDIGLCMPKVTYPNGDIQYLCKLLPDPFDLIGRRFFPKIISSKRSLNFEMRFSDYSQIMDVPYLSGCFMLCRNSILKKVKGFDENFFMYCEDIDLSRRINQISRTVYYPDVQIVHNHAKESYINRKMLFIHIKSAIYYFNKWGWIFDSERIRVNKKIINSIIG